MLTKEECCKAYENFRKMYDDDNWNPESISWSLDVFSELIDKHFDNPPLKFEELKPNMWVWDNEEKEYIQLIYHDYGYRKEWLYEKIGVKYELEFIFEENRYFRKKVDK